MATITIYDKEYELATNLKVAYLVQGQNNHKSYIDVFSSIDKMGIEQQVDILWASFKAANEAETKKITRSIFHAYVMDTFDLSMLMNTIREIVSGIMGKDLYEQVENDNESKGDSTEDFTTQPGMESSEEELKQD